MNKKAFIGGQEYTFSEKLFSLDDGQTVIICADECGERYVSSEQLWRSSALTSELAAPVNSHSTAREKIDFFLSTFKGRQDMYAKRYYSEKTGKSGYTPVCKNEWAYGLCDKRKYKCADCPNREFIPLTAEAVKSHLIGRDVFGRDVVAIYPMLEDNTTHLLVVDFDEENWQDDVSAFCKCCKEFGIIPAVERSRSGNGAHVWFFFSEPVSAADARRLGSSLLTQTMARRHELSFASYDRLFPSQDTVPKGGFGNLIALPFQGQAQKEGNSLFADEQFIPYSDQWAFLSSLPKIMPEQLQEYLQKICYDSEMGELTDTTEKQVPWQHKRTRSKLTNQDFPVQTGLVLSNLIYIDKHGFSQAALNTIKRLAAFLNPEFRAKQAMRLPLYNVSRVIDCGYEDNDYIGIPRGCKDALTELLKQYEVSFTFDDKRCIGHSVDVDFNGTLREEQLPAADALLCEDIGVLSATTAFGKTVIGAFLIGQRKVNTLILVHSAALLEQWKSSLEQFLDINEVLPEDVKKRGRKRKHSLIGQIGAGKNTRSGIVDIAIMQSLFEGEEKTVKSFVSEYGMVIVDECHHVAAFTFESILKSVESKYVYGLSATPVRKDGHQPIIFMQCGPIRYLVDAKSQAEKRDFNHFVVPRFTKTRLPNVGNIQDIYAGITENTQRNVLLVADALKVVQEGRTPILLTERKEHAVKLAALLEGKVDNIFLLIGSDRQKNKREKLADLQNISADEQVVVIATGKYIGEGFDFPRLDTLLLTMPISWKGTLAQYAGRLHRNYEGKNEVRVYDYVDIHIPTLERMYHKRLKEYAELGYQVKLGETHDTASSIYDGYASMTPFTLDLSDATKSVVIVSPYIQKDRVNMLLPTFRELLLSGIKIAVYINDADNFALKYQSDINKAISALEECGITVVKRQELQQKYAVIDESVVWYGNVDFLAFGKRDNYALHFENAYIAGELLDILNEPDGEQLTFDL